LAAQEASVLGFLGIFGTEGGGMGMGADGGPTGGPEGAEG